MIPETTLNNTSSAFVFVVCGAEEHISELNYSLAALQKFSNKNIFVITDVTRNKGEIRHDSVIHVQTPVHLDNHQASIFLKTSLHHYLPNGPTYCYLDTDVVGLNHQVDSVFDHYSVPITFAHDLCCMDQFSPSAIHCGCIEPSKQLEKLFAKYHHLEKKYHYLERERENLEKKKQLEQLFLEIKKDRLPYLWLTLRFWLSPNKFILNNDFVYVKKEKLWRDNAGNAVLYASEDSAIAKIEASTPYRCDVTNGHIWTLNGKEVFDCKCNHLLENIESTFGTKISQKDWHHWNGGVFLFDSSSHAFLNMWHKRTMLIFTLPNWKTRDQGTLISTVWEMGLQNAPVLPTSFNHIADYGHPLNLHLGELQFVTEPSKERINPNFIHVFHHWGDEKWDVWKAVEHRTGIQLNPDRQVFNGLWIGKELSLLELLTIRSFLDLGHSFKLWTYETITTPLPEGVVLADANEIIPRSQVFSYAHKNTFGHGKGSYAGFSDIFRYKLLYEKGGWWTDMDITCLRHINSEKAYFFRPHHELKVVGNLMKCPKGSELMRVCFEEAHTTINEGNTDWHAPIDILNRNIEKLGLEGYISKEVSNPDQWETTSSFIHSASRPVEPWLFIHWQNEEWRSRQIDRKNFYYNSFFAELLHAHGLSQKPTSLWAKAKNEVRHGRLVRAVLRFMNLRFS